MNQDYKTSISSSPDQSSGRVSHTSGSLNELGLRIEDVLALIDELETRLDPVLRSSAPTTVDPEKNIQTKVRLALAIDSQTEKVFRASQTLRDILERLEL